MTNSLSAPEAGANSQTHAPATTDGVAASDAHPNASGAPAAADGVVSTGSSAAAAPAATHGTAPSGAPAAAAPAATVPAPLEGPGGQRIAFIVDSCCDVLPSYLERYPFFVVPMNIVYSNGDIFEDRVNIQPDEVFERFATEVPKTSTPTPAAVHHTFEAARAAGATHVLCFSISSALSGTCSLMEATAFDYPDLNPTVIDTLNIGLGAGITAMYAAELAERGLDADGIAEVCRDVVPCTRIFIIPDTLEYLYKGGRISHAVYQIGQVLNMRPIITCDKNGYYAVAAKARGRKKSIKKAIELAQASVLPGQKFRVAMANGMAQEEMDALLADAPMDFALASEIIDGGNLSPALVVHTGPGLLGIVVQNFV